MSRKRNASNRFITVHVLRRVSASMFSLYKSMALSRTFANKWSKAVREADLGTMERLHRSVTPRAKFLSLSTNGIGYFIDFSFAKPISHYTNGTSIKPGTTQFYCHPRVQRVIASAIMPLYYSLACDKEYSMRVVKAIRSGNDTVLNRLILCKVKSRWLRSVRIDSSGFMLGFKHPVSRYTVYNQFFRDSGLK